MYFWDPVETQYPVLCFKFEVTPLGIPLILFYQKALYA